MPGLGRSPGGGHDNPLQYPCLENPMDRGAWQPTVHGVAKSQTPFTIYMYIYLFIWLHQVLDSKEIKPVSPKGNRPCTFIGMIDAEAEAPILWPPDAKN